MKTKHTKILKNFNFPKLVAAARKNHPDLNKRIERFNRWKQAVKDSREIEAKHDCIGQNNVRIEFNRDNYCFEFKSNLRVTQENPDYYTTECEKKYIGQYLYSEKEWKNKEYNYSNLLNNEELDRCIELLDFCK